MKKKPAGLEDRQWGQHQMVVCLECQRTDVDIIAWMVESYEKLQKPDRVPVCASRRQLTIKDCS